MLVQSNTETGSQDSRIRACYQCTPVFNPFSEDPAHTPTATSCPRADKFQKPVINSFQGIFFNLPFGVKTWGVWAEQRSQHLQPFPVFSGPGGRSRDTA